MPKTKTQGFIFGVIMSYAMAFGMEIYNIAINQGIHLAGAGFSAMTNPVFLNALKKMRYMGLFVILFNVIIAGTSITQLPAIWFGTVIKNFPMAFFWNMFAAAPFTYWLFNRLFH